MKPKALRLGLLLLGILALISCGGGEFSEGPASAATKESSSDDLETKEASANRQVKEREIETVRMREEQQRALFNHRRSSVLQEADRTLKLLDDLEAQVSKWSEVDTLLTSEEGRRIASSDEQMKIVQSVFERHKPLALDDTQATRARIEALVAPVKRAMQTAQAAEFTPTAADEHRVALEVERKSISDDLARFKKDVRIVQAAVGTTKDLPPATLTLETAIARYELERDKMEGQAIQERVEQERADALEKRAEEEAAKLRQIEEEKTRKRLAELEVQRAEQELERQRIEQEALLKESSQEKYATIFAPFFDYGETPVRTGKFIRNEDYDPPAPLSYSELKALGAMHDTQKGFELWQEVATHRYDSERTRWEKPAFGTDEEEKRRELHRLFIKLAPHFVKLKKLQE